MNKTSYKLLGVLIFLSLFILQAGVVSAQPTDYNLLAPVPLNSEVPVKTTNTGEYLAGLVKLAIGIAGLLAVIYIIFGGIQYMSTDAISGKGEAKKTIENAVWGFLLAISAWLILNTINPKLVETNLEIPREIPPTEDLSGGTAPSGSTASTNNLVPLSVPQKTEGQGACKTPGNCQVSQELNIKLQNLHNKIPIVVTEAYPPTRTDHYNSCHGAGTCVDVRAVADNRVYYLVDEARKLGLKAVFEVKATSNRTAAQRKSDVINASCGTSNQVCRSLLVERIDDKVSEHISADHFSIYN